MVKQRVIIGDGKNEMGVELQKTEVRKDKRNKKKKRSYNIGAIMRSCYKFLGQTPPEEKQKRIRDEKTTFLSR